VAVRREEPLQEPRQGRIVLDDEQMHAATVAWIT
jgi:hypothetical protein